MKKTKYALIIGLTGVMVGNAIIPIAASENTTAKEEVVYITAKEDGNVENINVVNIFEGGNVTDYGNYSSVKMLTTTDEIKQKNDAITFHSSADKVYYQGTLENAEIPWNISLRYFLNGKEYSADEIAGKSGELKIVIKITKNSSCQTSFYETYALQTTLLLDTHLCKNIQAKDATIAEVGANKQIAYTSLPNKGLNTTISATVKDFEMDAISINAIKLNLNLDIDDKELTSKVKKLMDATSKINQGATTLSNQSSQLIDGSRSVDSGISTLTTGVSSLDAGIDELQKGINAMQDGLNTLNNQSDNLTSGSKKIKTTLKLIQDSMDSVSLSTDNLKKIMNYSTQIKDSIGTLTKSITMLDQNLNYSQYKKTMGEKGLDIDQLKNNNQIMMDNCGKIIESLQLIIGELKQKGANEEQIAQLEQQINTQKNMQEIFRANIASIVGTESYINGLSTNVNQLDKGMQKLQTEYGNFHTAISQMTETLTGLVEQLPKLHFAMNELIKNYETFDTGLNGYTDGVAALVSGYTQLVNGMTSVSSGSKQLVSGSKEFTALKPQFFNGLNAYCNGVSQLYGGTSTLYEATKNMDTQLEKQIDEIMSSIAGEETKTSSFVSDKNKNVNNVQFVIKTKAIEKEEKSIVQKEVTKEKSLWEKFLALFGL